MSGFIDYISSLEVSKTGKRAFGAAVYSSLLVSKESERSTIISLLCGSPNLGVGDTFSKGSSIFYSRMVYHR